MRRYRRRYVDEFQGCPMSERPFLTRADVAALAGRPMQPETVSRYLTRSRPADPATERAAGPLAHDPFPAPDGYNGRWPWWGLDREREIREWFARHPARFKGDGVGGRPRRPRKA